MEIMRTTEYVSIIRAMMSHAKDPSYSVRLGAATLLDYYLQNYTVCDHWAYPKRLWKFSKCVNHKPAQDIWASFGDNFWKQFRTPEEIDQDEKEEQWQ